MDNDEPETKKYLLKTYQVTFAMLIIGQLHVVVVVECESVKSFLQRKYYMSLVIFFVSFLSLQLYYFFFSLIHMKAAWIRVICIVWTYECSTLCIMHPSTEFRYYMLGISFFLVYLIMILSFLYGKKGKRQLDRNHILLWSERIYVITCFGMLICSRMHRHFIEIVMLLFFTLISIVFIVVFASSLQNPAFFRVNSMDWLRIGQLFYLNFYVLFIGLVWTMEAIKKLLHTFDIK